MFCCLFYWIHKECKARHIWENCKVSPNMFSLHLDLREGSGSIPMRGIYSYEKGWAAETDGMHLISGIQPNQYLIFRDIIRHFWVFSVFYFVGVKKENIKFIYNCGGGWLCYKNGWIASHICDSTNQINISRF